MADRIRPSHDRLFRREIEGVIRALGKRNKVVAVTVTKTACPNCVYDEIHQGGSGKYNGSGGHPFELGGMCPVCQNVGDLTQERQLHLRMAKVRWGKANRDDLPKAQGMLLRGQAMITALMQSYQTLAGADYFVVDGHRCRRVGDLPQTRGLLTNATCTIVVEVDQ